MMNLLKSILLIVFVLILICFNELSQQNINENIDQNVDQNVDNNEINKLFVPSKTSTHCSENDLSENCDNNQNNKSETIDNKTDNSLKTNINNNKSSPQLLNGFSSQTNDNSLSDSSVDGHVAVAVASDKELPSVPTPAPPNEMLSFEEWRKKIAEQELMSETLLTKPKPKPKPSSQSSSQSQQSVPLIGQLSQNNKKTITKRARNFASYECGAKVVDTNPEAESVLRILNEQTDEYMLNPCKAKIWFVIELCETIQPQNIELANFELYSSVPKEFNIQASDHYPTRDWSSLGSFTAFDERSVQRFQLQNNGFVKFIKIEMLSHYGSEHFCPLSVIRIFGTSLFEEVERIDNIAANGQTISDEDSDSSLYEELVGEDASAQNLFGTARDAVFNIVRKAAQALNGNAIEVIDNYRNTSLSSQLNNIRLESIAMRLYPKISEYLVNCNQSNDNTVTIKTPTICIYLKCLFGDSLFNLLYEQNLNLNSKYSDKSLLFQCNYNTKNMSENIVRIESSIDTKIVDLMTSAESIQSIHQNSKSISIENISSDKWFSSDDSQAIKTTIIETISDDTNSNDATILPTNVPQISSIETKSEHFYTISISKESKEFNDSESLSNTSNSTKAEEIARNSTQNEMPSHLVQTINGNSHTSGPQSKESVVLRLSNRIKALEVNLSLSSQYLEELSLRYRKQMEEMQRAFNITISKLNDTASLAAERDLKQQESISLMEGKLNALNDKMLLLLSERESLNWHYIEVHIGLMMIEVVIVIALLFICVFRLSKRIRFLQTNQSLESLLKTHSQSISSHNVSPNKRLHPNHSDCHLPAKTPKISDDMNIVDCDASRNNNNAVNFERKIRKKKKKKNGGNVTNILVPQIESQHNSIKIVDENKSLLIAKCQSTPVLTNNTFTSNTNSTTNSTTNSNINSNIDVNKSRNSSCHSSSSGVSSISALSNPNVFTSKTSKLLNDINFSKKSSNDKLLNNKKQTEKSSLTFSFKKLLKIERK